MMRKAIFLDRDGVLNRAPVLAGRPQSPKSLSELEILEPAIQACARLKSNGFVLIGVTNQPDIARGKVSAEMVEAINEKVAAALALDDIRTCPHDNADDCDCRKPKPGLIMAAAKDHGIDLSHSIMVGDRNSDIEAGIRARCKTVFIDYGYQEQRPQHADFNCTDLLEAAPWIIENLNS